MRKPVSVTWCVLFVLANGVACGQTASIRKSGKGSPDTVPIILDTDIGTDIDDAFALALALASPELELRGVTTVSGDAFTRAMIACRFLDAVGHPRVPVAAGLPPRKIPMLDGQYQYGLRPARKHPVNPSAVELLYEALKADPGRITLVTVGDLTNVARLIREHPDCKAWIKRVVLMGGSIRVGYRGTLPIDREWNIRSDIAAAQTVFRSGIPLVVAPLDATVALKLAEPRRRLIFATDNPLCRHLHALYELWGKPTPTLFDPMAVTLAFDESFCTMEELRIDVDEDGFTREVSGIPNCRVATGIRAADYLQWYVERITAVPGSGSAVPDEPRNVAPLVPHGCFPNLVHVVEDYETEIERRWWLAGRIVKDEASSSSDWACRAVLCRDFDARMGNQQTIYRAVVFNPVPGPPMGPNTRLFFRYRLEGTDTLRVQIYSLTNNYHRHLTLRDLPHGRWQSATVDMTRARRGDGSGGPLAQDERIDDIQFYVEPGADLTIDDIVLYDAALRQESRPFPRHIHFTAWFDTGQHGREWPGDFRIVAHQRPRTWKAARSVPNAAAGSSWIRLTLRGMRLLGEHTSIRFRYQLEGTDTFRVILVNSRTKQRFEATVDHAVRGSWSETTIDYHIPPLPEARPPYVNEIHFLLDPGGDLSIDDLLLYEPAEPEAVSAILDLKRHGPAGRDQEAAPGRRPEESIL